MKLISLACAITAANAFMAPVPAAKSSSALNVNELEIGVTDPLGVFDPLGWLETQPEAFERRRAVERKHGRIAMVAVVGMLVHNAGIELPGSLTLDGSVPFSSISDGFTGLFEVRLLLLLLLLCVCARACVWLTYLRVSYFYHCTLWLSNIFTLVTQIL